MSSIRLHPEHGVNPTIVQCFWCGKDRGEIALLGAAYRTEAPRHMVLDYEPCDTCRGEMAQGITLVECALKPIDKRPEIQQGRWPTGSWCVITEEATRRLFNPPELVEQIVRMRKCFVEVGVIQMFEEATKEASGNDS